MNAKLIVDSGSTKTEWALIEDNKLIRIFITEGFNPYYVEKEALDSLFNELLPKEIRNIAISEIYFYGTGCSTKENCNPVHLLFSNFFDKATITVQHDLYGAAVALLQNKSGIACILGTGSNSCLWDGKSIVANVPSLGYMLGDEGSGTYLGKLILKEILSGKTDKVLENALFNYTGLEFSGILHKIYKEKTANRWIASLAKFAKEQQKNPMIRKILYKNFQDFIDEQICRYDNFQNVAVAFTGSVAFHFQDVLKEVMNKNGIKISHILKEPMEGLITYHLKK